MLETAQDLLANHGFRAGFFLGGLATLGLVYWVRRHEGRRLQIGLVMTVAVLASLAVQSLLSAGLVVGMLVLVVGAAAAAVRDDAVVGRVAVTVPGAVLVAVTALGVWATTPDTEHAVVLAGVALPMALLGWPLSTRASLGAVGAESLTAIVSWTAAIDGSARSSAVLGGMACLGMLVIEPAVRRARRGPVSATAVRRPSWPVAIVALHVVLVLVCSRIAGLSDSAAVALAIIAAAYVVTAGACRRLLGSHLAA